MGLNNDYSGFVIDDMYGFKTEKHSQRLNWEKNFKTTIVYEVSPDLTLYNRIVYRLLDFLSEIGGLIAVIGKFCLVIVTLLQFHDSFYFVMAITFFSQSRNKKLTNDVQYNSIKSCRLNFHRYCH